MRRLVFCFLTAVCFCLLFSCSNKLSDQVAFNELSKYHKPEVVLYKAFANVNTVLGNNVTDMIKNNNLVVIGSGFGTIAYTLSDSPDKGVPSGYYLPNEKAYSIVFPVARTKIGKVTDVLIEKDGDKALVSYTTILEPIEPYYSKICIDKSCPYYGDKLNNGKMYKAKFKRYDKGWRIDQE